jgi:hypothetical protein
MVQPIGDMAPVFARSSVQPVWLAKNYPQTFGTLLGKMPMQVAAAWREPTLTASAGFTPARPLLRGISARPPAQL